MNKDFKYWSAWAECLQEDLPILANMEFFMHKCSNHSTGGRAVGFRYSLEGTGSKSFIEGLIKNLNSAIKDDIIKQASVILYKTGGSRASRVWKLDHWHDREIDSFESEFLVKYFSKTQKGLQLIVYTSPKLETYGYDKEAGPDPDVKEGVVLDKYLSDVSIY